MKLTTQQREAKRQFLMSLRAGDVLRINGTLRVLRAVSWRQYRDHPPTGCFVFATRKCSWTNHAYTVKKSSDLFQCDISLVGRGYKSKLPIEQKLDECIANRMHQTCPSLKCCDVAGVIA